MLCNTCENEIEESEWKKQCLNCFKQKIKKCIFCNIKKKNSYNYCFDCFNNHNRIHKTRSKKEDDLYNSQFNISIKNCQNCQNKIPNIKWRNYCNVCYLEFV